MARALYSAIIIGLFAFGTDAFAQLQSTLIVTPNPPKQFSDWRASRDVIKLLVTNTKGPINVRIDAKLKLNGTIVAATKREIPEISIPPGQTILYGSDLIAEQFIDLLGELKSTTVRTGILPEGNYEFCVQLLTGAERNPASNAECRSFTMLDYILPQLILPEQDKEFIAGMEKLTTFRWTSLMPPPSFAVVYKLRAVEVLPGQTPQQAFMVNLPLFERKITNMLQASWPVEIPISPKGLTVAWGIQPEDLEGRALVTPEGFTQPFTVKFLPMSAECAALNEKLSQYLKTLTAMEERYWTAYAFAERAERLQEEAEDRGDAYEVEHWQAKRISSTQSLETTRERYEAAYAAYEDALKAYKECVEKQR